MADEIDTSRPPGYGQCARCKETCKLKHMEADLCDRCADGDKVAKLEAEKAPRWLVFCGEPYYPQGGADDFYGAYATEEEAHEAAQRAMEAPDTYGRQVERWAQVVDVRVLVSGDFDAEQDAPYLRFDPPSEKPRSNEPGFGPKAPGGSWERSRRSGEGETDD